MHGDRSGRDGERPGDHGSGYVRYQRVVITVVIRGPSTSARITYR
jgi:hypothetical protein